MKWVWNILAVLLVLTGIVWFLQGISVLPGSFMTGDTTYTYLGVILVVIGAIILYFNNRRRRLPTGGDRTDLDR